MTFLDNLLVNSRIWLLDIFMLARTYNKDALTISW